ncbi:BTAD domain-containing putative transcriptional regulator [Streptomyces sodiiphilus]|uniref:BTAD domain-containing putative transcriptional regulator n=1 Tax=Streptomyces sodiiphilus TaxID=226217 RepID=A0ABP5A6G3_9ACTN
MTPSDRPVTRLRFNILGPFEGWADGRQLRLGGALRERTLVMLLLETGSVLPVSRLVAAAWDEAPPNSAAHQIRKAVADLRQRIPGGSELITTTGPGYRIVVEEEQLDHAEFRAGVRAARAAVAEGKPESAVSRFGEALRLWRGPVMAGYGGQVVDAVSAVLEEQRLAAAEQFFELCLRLGESAELPNELVGRIKELTEQYPLSETLRGQLMLALYRTGRQADALAEYERIRLLLTEEMGVDPGPRLGGIFEQILQQRPEIGPSAAVAVPAVPSPVPAPVAISTATSFSSLPGDLSDFVGRDQEMRQLARAVAEGTRIVAIDGMGGSGKTALAVHAAHRLAERYPDGRLFVDLRGHTPGEEPLTAGVCLETLLRSAGLPAEQIPDDLSARTALWRAVTACRRMLMILDNAQDVAQTRPLLPSGPENLTLLTSRARLVDLDGARWLSLGVLPPEASVAFLRDALGAERVDAEPEPGAELVELCGHLPLALRIAAARLQNRPQWSLSFLAGRMRDESRKLGELRSADRSVAAALRLSMVSLDLHLQSSFRLVGLHPGRDIDPASAAALLGTDPERTEEILETLLDVHLLGSAERGRYAFHDLVRSFARSLCGPDTEKHDHEAVTRLLNYYIATAENACDLLFPKRPRLSHLLPDATTAYHTEFATADQALAWLDTNRVSLLAAVRLAGERQLHRHAACLPRSLSYHSHLRNYPGELLEAYRTSVDSARRLNEPALLVLVLTNLANLHWKLGNFFDGTTVLKEAREIAAGIEDREGVAYCLSQLGTFYNSLGRLEEALDSLTEAVRTHRELGAPAEEALALSNISSVLGRLGRFEKSAEAAAEALAVQERIGETNDKIDALANLSAAHLGLGRPERALECLEKAQDLCEMLRRPANTVVVLAHLADVWVRLGGLDRAAGYAERALRLAEANSSPVHRARVRNAAGRVADARGNHAEALRHHKEAYAVSARVMHRYEMLRSLDGMAAAAAGSGSFAEAAAHLAEADALAAEMNITTDRSCIF